jgi:hypothetical protein
MAALHTSANAIYLMQILAAAFLAILFLQSGIAKIIDRRGNLEWLKDISPKAHWRELFPRC